MKSIKKSSYERFEKKKTSIGFLELALDPINAGYRMNVNVIKVCPTPHIWKFSQICRNLLTSAISNFIYYKKC